MPLLLSDQTNSIKAWIRKVNVIVIRTEYDERAWVDQCL